MSRFRLQSSIKKLIIHCAATPNGKPFTAADVDCWHGERGFRRNPDALLGKGQWEGQGRHASDLAHTGYHYTLRIDGTTEIGRRLSETGAHARGHNHDSIGVMLFGTDRFTLEQWDTLRNLVLATQRDFEKARLPKLEVMGHNQVSRKSCPGFDVRAWLSNGMQPLPAHILEAA